MAPVSDIKLIMKEGPSINEEFPIAQTQITMGRDPASDWVIDFTAVSRNHAKITTQGDNHFIEDIGSSNGTFVNGQKIEGRHLLNTGDVIGLGMSVKIEYHGVEVETPAPAKHATKPKAPPKEAAPVQSIGDDLKATAFGEVVPEFDDSIPPELSVGIAGSVAESYTLTKDKLTFGRANTNDIVVDSPVVSREHGHIEKAPGGGYRLVVSPQAGNAVYLNGRVVKEPTHL
ncbi:MAG: FHA domain-containing protein, partial [Chloroflexota bacterium]